MAHGIVIDAVAWVEETKELSYADLGILLRLIALAASGDGRVPWVKVPAVLEKHFSQNPSDTQLAYHPMVLEQIRMREQIASTRRAAALASVRARGLAPRPPDDPVAKRNRERRARSRAPKAANAAADRAGVAASVDTSASQAAHAAKPAQVEIGQGSESQLHAQTHLSTEISPATREVGTGNDLRLSVPVEHWHESASAATGARAKKGGPTTTSRQVPTERYLFEEIRTSLGEQVVA